MSNNEINEIKLSEADCRNVAEALAPEYGSVVSTQEIASRVYEIHGDMFRCDHDELHQDTIDRIYWLVQHAKVTVTFPEETWPVRTIRTLEELIELQPGQVVYDARGEWFKKTKLGLYKKFGMAESVRHDEPKLPAKLIDPSEG